MRRIILVLALAVTILTASAEKPFWGQSDVYLERQTAVQLRTVDSLLLTPDGRVPALLLLDGILHDTRLDGAPAVASWMRGRIGSLIDSLDAPLTGRMRLCRLYNDGWVLQTPSRTYAFDLFRGPVMADGQRLIADTLMQSVADRCDILLLSHNHADHIDTAVVNMMTARGKTVYGPPGPLLDGREGVTAVYPSEMNQLEADIAVIPGHQDELPNNIYIVTTPEGLRVAHTGDQYHRADLDMLEGLRLAPVDVLMVDCWANSLPRLIAAFSPSLALTSHENEVAFHGIDHREAFWQSLRRLQPVTAPSLVLAWAECLSMP